MFDAYQGTFLLFDRRLMGPDQLSARLRKMRSQQRHIRIRIRHASLQRKAMALSSNAAANGTL